jgi:hypothetical protein
MDQSVFLFPYHTIALMQRGHRIIAVVTLFGLFYCLVVLTTTHRLITEWDNCMIVSPQSRECYEPTIRGAFFPTIPESGFNAGDDVYRKAVQYGEGEFLKALTDQGSRLCVGTPKNAD